MTPGFERMKALLGFLRGAYQRFEVTDATIRVWAEMLSDLDFDECFQAAKDFTSTSHNAPTIADIRRLVASRKVSAPSWEAAWQKVLEAIPRTKGGRDGVPAFDSPLVAEAVSAIGWASICNTLVEDHPTLRAQFRDAYRSCVLRAERKENVGRLEAHDRARPRLEGPATPAKLLPPTGEESS